MSDIHIAGTGIWYPEDKISNTELVGSYNNYVRRFNIDNSKKIDSGDIVRMEESSVEFIVKASGIESRHVIDKDGILDIDSISEMIGFLIAICMVVLLVKKSKKKIYVSDL